MAEIRTIEGKEVIDYMARDYDSILESMKSLIPRKLPEWTDYNSEADFGNVLLQLFAYMGDILSYYQDRIANESFLGTAQSRRSIIHHLRLIGYKLSTAAPASTELQLTFTVPVEKKGTVVISQGDAFATKSQKERASVRFEYTREAPITIDLATLTPDPDGKNKSYEGTFPIEEGRMIKEEFLGASDGAPNQRFTLAHSPLILRSQIQNVNKDILLITRNGTIIEEWRLQENLAFSREELKDFAIEIDEDDRATIVFGDGFLGKIPAKGANIIATYRVGGGLAGNVSKDSIQTIVNAPQLAEIGAKITNPEQATGGAEKESIDHAVSHAPGVFRTLKRAVTKEDYEALALDFKGVGKVRAEAAGWNTVSLFIAPENGGQISDMLRANLLAYFENLRPVTTLIEINDVTYVKIYVAAKVGIDRYYDQKNMIEKVKSAAGELLAFRNVDFKMPVYLSKFYEAIQEIEGVSYVTISEFRSEREERAIETDGKIILGANEIPIPPDETGYEGGIKVDIVQVQK